jgi:hypothetical protein
MYLSSRSGTLKAVSGSLSAKKRLKSHDDHHIEHFGRLILELQESIKHQTGEAARTLLGYVRKARPSSNYFVMVCGVIPMKRERE